MELAVAVPQVVAHRLTQMALAGPNPCARDRKEFHMMINEKTTAFAHAWGNLTLQAFRANQAIATSMLHSFFTPFSNKTAPPSVVQMQNATLDVLSKGLAPIHRKAVSNAKRLAKTRLR